MGGTVRAATLAATVAILGVGEAQAGAFGIREQSTEAQGVAFAGAAAGSGGVSSLFWNPATITMNPGFVTEQNFTYIGLSSEIRPDLGTNPGFARLGGSGDIGQGAVVPAGATAYQLNDRLWLGLAMGAPFGLITKPHQVWAGEVYGRSSRIFSLAINPVLGFKVNEWLSLAAGPNIEYFRLTLRQALPIPGILPTAYPSAFLKGESWGAGFTAGATLTPRDGTVLGIGYRSSVHHDIDGSIGVPLLALAPLAGPVRSKLNTPDKLSVGLTQALSPVARVDLGFEWDNWSRLGTIGVVSNSLGLPVSTLPLNYKDGFLYAIGAEYDASPNLTLRTGFGYETSPIDFRNRSVRLPDGDRYSVSVGASYRWNERLTLNLAYSHLFLDRSRILAGIGRDYNVSNIAFAGVVDASADIVSVGFRYVFGAPPAPAPAPLVRKY
ncbi:OmpP1/FadL family transporter [Methylobacterium sp. P31]